MGGVVGVLTHVIAKLGGIVTQASGSIGGVTFANKRGVTVISAKQHVPTTASAAQTQHKAAFSRAAAAWAELTTAQRLAWGLYALSHPRQNRLGVARKLTPYQFWLLENTLRAQAGIPLRTNPPRLGQSGVGSFDNLSFTAGGPYTLAMTAPATDASGYYVIYGARSTRNLSMGKRYMRFVGAYPAAPSIDQDLQPDWDPIMGTILSGEVITVAIRYLGNSSLASPTTTLTLTVA